jgi:hypothetical protein
VPPVAARVKEYGCAVWPRVSTVVEMLKPDGVGVGVCVLAVPEVKPAQPVIHMIAVTTAMRRIAPKRPVIRAALGV